MHGAGRIQQKNLQTLSRTGKAAIAVMCTMKILAFLRDPLQI